MWILNDDDYDDSVVQRQLWLLNNVPDMEEARAYDIARREFYRLRHQQEIERRVAAEEAQATGARFGPRRLEIGMQLESKVFGSWKRWAKRQIQVSIQNSASSSGSSGVSSEPEVEQSPIGRAETASTPERP